jgi:Homeodomain-like domain/Integrase core domain
MSTEEKIARSRLSVLELSYILGNVRAACHQHGMTPTQFDAYQQCYQQYGIEGLKDLPPIHQLSPQTIPPKVVEQILAIRLAQPAWSSDTISVYLTQQGMTISEPTVQDILLQHGRGSKEEQIQQHEQRALDEGIVLTAEQMHMMEQANPGVRERHVERQFPGHLLYLDTFFVGLFNGIGELYLHIVIDSYSGYAFGFLYPGQPPEAAVAVLHNDVLPFYQGHGLAVEAVLTDNRQEWCGASTHPLELYLALNDIKHRRSHALQLQTSSCVERF